MAPNFLRSLPQELRDEIYRHVLRSPTGYVSTCAGEVHDGTQLFKIKVYDPTKGVNRREEITLHLLRVCKQIYLECKDIFWRENTFGFQDSTHFLKSAIHLDIILRPRIDRAQMNIDLWDMWAIERTSQALRYLEIWSRSGGLKTIILNVAPKKCMFQGIRGAEYLLGNKEIEEETNLSPKGGLYSGYLEILRNAGESLSGIQRGLVFRIGWDRLSKEKKQHCMDCRELVRLRGVVKEYHDVFGGELWVDGRLCFKDHSQVEEVFRVS